MARQMPNTTQAESNTTCVEEDAHANTYRFCGARLALLTGLA
jgi:hypothetical protein